MERERLILSDSFWLSLASTFGSRRAMRDEAASVFAIEPAPAAAFFPEDPSEVSIVVDTARNEKVPLAVLGACTRIAGGLARRLPEPGYVALGTERMAGVEEVQQDSLWMKVQAGTRLSEAAGIAGRHGCRLAGTVDSDSGTVGGWLSSRSGIRDWILGIDQPPVLSLEAVLPTGNLIHSVTTPRSATGPDLFSLLLGTWGGFGVITRATVKLEPLPEQKLQAEFNFPSTKKAVGLLRDTLSRTFPPSQAMVVIEKADEWRKARVLLSFEGQREVAQAGMAAARRMAKAAGGREAARGRASIRPRKALLQAGVRWSGLMQLLRAVDQEFSGHNWAIIDRPCLTGCRLGLDLPDTDENHRKLEKILDPEGSTASSLTSARELLAGIRKQLDPAGLISPHAWPLPWPGGRL